MPGKRELDMKNKMRTEGLRVNRDGATPDVHVHGSTPLKAGGADPSPERDA
jgi:hypothetical protein